MIFYHFFNKIYTIIWTVVIHKNKLHFLQSLVQQ